MLSAVESDAKIQYLHDENKVMAAEIELLKATITDLAVDNENTKKNLDIKQN